MWRKRKSRRKRGRDRKKERELDFTHHLLVKLLWKTKWKRLASSKRTGLNLEQSDSLREGQDKGNTHSRRGGGGGGEEEEGEEERGSQNNDTWMC